MTKSVLVNPASTGGGGGSLTPPTSPLDAKNCIYYYSAETGALAWVEASEHGLIQVDDRVAMLALPFERRREGQIVVVKNEKILYRQDNAITAPTDPVNWVKLGSTTAIIDKSLPTTPPNPANPEEGDLLTELYDTGKEVLKVWDATKGQWSVIFDRNELSLAIARSALFQGTAKQTATQGAITLAQIPAPALSNKGFYWIWSDILYTIQVGDLPNDALAGSNLKSGDWLQSTGNTTTGSGGFVIVSGDLINKGRFDGLGLHTFNAAESYEKGSVVYDKNAIYFAGVQIGASPTLPSSGGTAWTKLLEVKIQNANDVNIVGGNPIDQSLLRFSSASGMYEETVTLPASVITFDETDVNNRGLLPAMLANQQLQVIISDMIMEAVGFLKLDGSRNMTSDINMGGNKITNIADGVLQTDGVSVNQLSAVLAGQKHGVAVRAYTFTIPVAPVIDEYYLIKADPSLLGTVWEGKPDQITYWGGTSWVFLPPTQGDTHLVVDEQVTYNWNGTAWVAVAKQQGSAGGIVGTTIQSLLTDTQMQAQVGGDWVLADGRSVVGSTYHAVTGQTHIPDLRGAFLRMSGNNSTNSAWAGGVTNSFNEDKTARPTSNFTISSGGNHMHSLGWYDQERPDIVQQYHNHTAANPSPQVSHMWKREDPASGSEAEGSSLEIEMAVSTDGAHSHTIGGGDTETTPKHYSLNFFIKVN